MNLTNNLEIGFLLISNKIQHKLNLKIYVWLEEKSLVGHRRICEVNSTMSVEKVSVSYNLGRGASPNWIDSFNSIRQLQFKNKNFFNFHFQFNFFDSICDSIIGHFSLKLCEST